MKKSTKTALEIIGGSVVNGAVFYTGMYATTVVSCIAVAAGQYKSAVLIAITGTAATAYLADKAGMKTSEFIDECISDESYATWEIDTPQEA